MRMKFHRLGLVFGAAALIGVGTYACSSDDNGGGTSGADSGVDTGTVNPVDTGAPNNQDDGSVGDNEEPATVDAGDSGSTTNPADCIGNPLVADGGSPDASFDASVATSVGSGNFLYGPLWVNDLGGGIVYSASESQVVNYQADGGGTAVQLAPTNDPNALPLQNAASNGFLYTAISDQLGDGGAIMKTQIDGGGAAGTTTFMRLPVTDGGLLFPSGIAIHSKGVLFFTDPQFQNGGIPAPGVYSMPIAGGAITTLNAFTSEQDDRPVGIAFNKDQSALFVTHYAQSVSVTGHISKYAIDANGAAGAPTNLPFLPAGRPLGIAIDTAGNIWIAEETNDSVNVNGLVEVIDSTGTTLWGSITIPNVHATGIAFGGADKKRVFITTENGDTPAPLYEMPTRCQGL